MHVETAIDSWAQWNGDLSNRPVIKEPLGGGRSNRSFLLEAGGQRMVLRLNAAESLLPKAGRSNETRVWQAAAEQGIAPPLLFVDERHRYLVSRYIDNTLPPRPPYAQACIEQAFGLLKRCHQLDADVAAIDYAGHIEGYWQAINNKVAKPGGALLAQREPMRKQLETLIDSDTPAGLCHHDPAAANFIGSADRLYLIDWEYAARGLPVMDYAALAIEWKIGDNEVMARTGIEPEILTIAKSLYEYVCELWALLQGA